MPATVIDGKILAESIRGGLKSRVAALKAAGVSPCLAVILVGEDAASQSYVNSKEKDCAEIGIQSLDKRFPASYAEDDLLALIERLNADPKVHGILVQLPLPKHIDERKIIAALDPSKDVDGFTPVNIGRLVIGEPCYLPCTPHGVVRMIQSAGIPINGKHAVVVGRSNIVGKPVANLLVRKDMNATVTVCHTGTKDIASFTRQADIVIACAGKPGLITADMVKSGACVIDVGINRVDDTSSPKGYKLVGDVDFEGVSKVAGCISPVPRGVGPMTRAMLLENTVLSAEGAVYPRKGA
jgi:methylenetetrahydrofolate dehydrogenase (NADP+) / methenyltetrahydrofolate cyclohydrolase